MEHLYQQVSQTDFSPVNEPGMNHFCWPYY